MKRVLAMGIPYAISLLLTLVLGFLFTESIVFNVVPIIAAAFMTLQIVIFLNRDSAKNSNISNGNLSDDEAYSLLKAVAYTTVFTIPVLIPFVIFFSLTVKTIVSSLSWALSLAIGFVVFRIKHGGEIKNRISKEETELKEQQKREEQGII